jgi:hypothetical protein
MGAECGEGGEQPRSLAEGGDEQRAQEISAIDLNK